VVTAEVCRTHGLQLKAAILPIRAKPLFDHRGCHETSALRVHRSSEL
jgi:hypothetical protein